ncbi:MAG: NapC/NirT family cytochrome c [Alphaproteobacteria bacterium]|jgi:nitrate/TMAO reductase-like tetraheme cytochrome c subunit|nr:NapC/NirT family cytochrome c [Alphaproteobacteria bacterium]
MSRLWRWFWRPSARVAWGAIFIAGGLAGVVFWGGFNTFMEYTNTLDFCITCHEMRDNVYPEYQKTVHYRNPSGVRVICADCHVPREWTAKLVRKIRASNELFHKIVGSIDTPEKFDEARMAMATRVWDAMRANDSRECRNCHSYHAMDFEKQGRRAARQMQKAKDKGKTCIDCHKGIAHRLPPGYEEDDD